MSNDNQSSASSPALPKLPPWLVILLVIGFLGFAWYQNRQKQEPVQQVRQLAKPTPNQPSASTPTTASPDEVLAANESRDEPVVPEVTPDAAVGSSNELTPPNVGHKPATLPDRTPAATRAGPNAPLANRLPGGISSTTRNAPDSKTSPQSPTQPKNDPRRDTPKPANVEGDKKPTLVENQTIRDFGKVVFKGTIDLQPTLDRIARGERNSHRNDGSTFGNRERRLPQKQQGYYTEYVHPTKGINGPGPQRVIFGKGGDVWYTPDHYETFKKIK
jgi:ribonuclease T1